MSEQKRKDDEKKQDSSVGIGRDGRGKVSFRRRKDAPTATTEPAPKKGKPKK